MLLMAHSDHEHPNILYGTRALLTEDVCDSRMPDESGCGPVAVLVFKTSGRGGEPRRWVRLPRALGHTT